MESNSCAGCGKLYRADQDDGRWRRSPYHPLAENALPIIVCSKLCLAVLIETEFRRKKHA